MSEGKKLTCSCGHALDAERYKAEFEGLSKEKVCLVSIAEKLIENKPLENTERAYLAGVVCMQLAAIAVVEEQEIDMLMSQEPKGRPC